MIVSLSSLAAEFTYSFDNTPVAEALAEIAKDHPGLDINFIYKELDLYTTSARILTDSPVDAVRRTVGRNPITVIVRGGAVYVEAMQHGRFCERLVHDFGFHLARQYLQANLCAVRQFRALVRQKRIDCGFSDESSFIYAASDGPSLTRELEYALSLGAPARLVKPEGLPFPVREALCFERQAQLSPPAVPRGAAAGADGL